MKSKGYGKGVFGEDWSLAGKATKRRMGMMSNQKAILIVAIIGIALYYFLVIRKRRRA
jgi:hypothetical protein